MGIYQLKPVKYKDKNGDEKIKYIRPKNAIKNAVWGIDYRDSNGRRIREVIGKNKRIAEIVLEKRKIAIAENRHLDKKVQLKRIKLSNYIELYIENYSKVNKKTFMDDIYMSNTIKKFFSDIYLDQITALDIEKYKKERKKSIKEASINRELALLKSMFNRALEWNYSHCNPMKSVKLYKENNKRLRYLSEDEISRLLKNTPTEIYSLIITALNTGMRRGEMLNLQWGDIDLKRAYLHIKKSKNGRSRNIPLNETLLETLINLYLERKPERNDYVFLNTRGKRYIDIRKPFVKALKLSDIKDFKFHDLRHTAASYMVMGGANLKTVQEILGHEDIQMTMRYAHLAPQIINSAVKSLDKILTKCKDKNGHDLVTITENEITEVDRKEKLLTRNR